MKNNAYIQQVRADRGPDAKIGLRDIMNAHDYEVLGPAEFKKLVENSKVFPGMSALRLAAKIKSS